MPRHLKPLTIATVLALSLAATAPAAVAKDSQASKFYEDALQRYEKKDTAGAILQLKNALNEDPKMLAAHALLGNAFLQNSQPQEALDALEKGLKLGIDPTEVTIPIAQAMLDLGRGAELLKRFPPESLPDAARRSELLVLRGFAHRQSGDVNAAAREYETARATNPRSTSAVLSLADLNAQQGRLNEAMIFADQAIAIDDKNPKVWYQKGSILQMQGQNSAALDAYGKTLALDPRHADARVTRLSLLLSMGRSADAVTDFDFFKRENPKEPRANYLRAVFLSEKGDAAGTRDALLAAAASLDPAPPEILQSRAPELLLLAGLVHHGLNQHQKARSYLEYFLKVSPHHPGARKLLGSVLVARRDYVTAINIMEPALKVTPKDPQLLTLLANAYMARGRTPIANQMLQQALELSGSAANVQSSLGFSFLQGGRPDIAMGHLKSAFEKDASLENTAAALVVLYMRQGDTKSAIDIAERVVKRDPSNLAGLNLLGLTKAQSGDFKGARVAYEKALSLDKNFVTAQLNLGKLELAEGNATAARTRFGAMLKSNPKDVQAMYEMAMLEQKVGKPAESITWLERLVATDSRHVSGSMELIDARVRAKDLQKAVELARSMEVQFGGNLDVLATVARTLIAARDEKGAQTVLAKMTRLAEFDPSRQYQIAQLQLQANNPSGAIYSLEKALSEDPNNVYANVLLAEVDLNRGNIDAAETRANTLLKSNPELGLAHRLLADIAMKRGKTADGLARYRTALAKEPTTENALRLFQALLRAGTPDKAAEFMEGWVKGHPNNPLAARALAEGYFRAGNLAAARARYEDILKKYGDDAGILNNIANIFAKQGDKAKAIEYADRAYRVQPTDPYIQDTLGWLLAQNGDPDTGLKHLREARLREPRNADIRYHLAATLARMGRKEEARQELAEVLRDSPTFESLNEARALQKQLATN